MENSKISSDRDTTEPPVIKVVLSPSSKDQVDLIQKFRNMFYETFDVDYLNSAIGLCEELFITDKGIVSILENLREVRNGVTGIESDKQAYRNHDKSLSVNDKDQKIKHLLIPTQLDTTSTESVAFIQNYLNLFVGTGDLDHLNKAIESAQELELKDKGIQPLLDYMLAERDMRKNETRRLDSNILQNGATFVTVRLSEDGKESGETIQTLYNVFIETHDLDYLDSAIGIAEELAETEEGIKPMLDYMLKTKSGKITDTEVPDKAKEDNSQDTKNLDRRRKSESLSQISDMDREAEPSIAETLYQAFLATGDIEYLDNAIMMAEGLVDSANSVEEKGSSRTILVRLLEERFDRTKDLQDLDILIKSIQEIIPLIKRGSDHRGMLMAKLSEKYYYRYEKMGVLEDFQLAIKWTEDIAAEVPPSNPNWVTMLRNLIVMLQERYEKFGSLEHLERAIHWSKISIKTTPPTAGRASICGNLGRLLDRRFAKLGDPEDLNQGIRFVEEGISATSPIDLDNVNMPVNLGGMLLERYELLGALEDLEKAIRLTKDALAVIPPDSPHREGISSNLFRQLHARYDRLGDIDDLQQSIQYTEHAMLVLSPGSSEWAKMSTTLGELLRSKYRQLGAIEDLQQAIQLVRDAIATEPSDITDLGNMFDSLGFMLTMRFEKLQLLEDLEEAIIWAEKAVMTTARSSRAGVNRSANLASALHARYMQLGNLSDLEEAIKLATAATTATPPSSTHRTPMVNNLGNMMRARFEELGALEDLNKAIEFSREGISLTPTSSPKSVTLYNNLSIMLKLRYEQLGTLKDLEEAIRFMGDAVTASLPENPSRGAMFDSLGTMLMARYGRLGDLEDLEQAIRWGEKSVIAVHLRSNDQCISFVSLASMLERRYQRLGDMEDLQKAITWAERGLNSVQTDSPRQVELSGTLAVMLHSRYEQLKDPEDLQRAIIWGEQAVKVKSAVHRPSRYKNLGVMIQARYDETGALEDLEMAIKWTEKAISVSPPNSPARGQLFLNLASGLKQRYQRLGNTIDLEKGIQSMADAVAGTPPEDPNRAGMLYGQAQILTMRYLQTKSLRDFNHILHSLYEAWYSQVSPPTSRVRAARMAAQLLATKKRWAESSSLLEDAVRMLPKLSARYLGQEDQEYRLSDFSRLAADTVSTAFQAGHEASYCLRLLEFGRGIIMGHVIDCRSDLSDLQLKHPSISKRYYDLRTEVDSSSIGGVNGEDIPHPQQRHREATQELDETLIMIRELPGFEGFQLPAHSSVLMALASNGPIVILNTTQLRSDAIIVTTSAIQGLALPELVYSIADEKMGRIGELVRGKRNTYKERNEKLGELLLWLWDVAVEPVLQALGYESATDQNDLPQIWWIGVGPMAVAPFHAAGDHTPGSTRNTLSQTISSYIPTIKSLSYAREKKLQPLSESQLLLISMPTTPNHPPLQSATAEVEKILEVVEGKSHAAQMENPTAADVLRALPSYHAIHFACHGLSDRKKPSQSHLLLQTDSGEVDKLTVKAISDVSLRNAQIAYLSACSTANNSSNELADESIYIASGFQLAGFSHVLATQWPSNDKACEKVATDFYTCLFKYNGVDGDDGGHRKVGASFHYAVKSLRVKYPRQPIMWAPFIHTGA